jgi:acetyl-CoA carboxylase biotin carboxyl carrier protein
LLTFEQIKELIDLVTERRLQSLEIERSGFRLRIDGKAPPQVVQVEAGASSASKEAAQRPVTARSEPVSVPAAAEEQGQPESAKVPEGSHVLHSPIVGTFYAAPSPDADPYVRIGDRVKKGQVLCIVEAMKLMNEIESDVDGRVVEIFPNNAQPVEYGEPLFAILP